MTQKIKDRCAHDTTKFRQWATERLKEYIVKGFTLDDERLKNGGGRYFRELYKHVDAFTYGIRLYNLDIK
jgi:hypothetical protein